MKLYIELKLREDDHNNRFTNGLTLCGSKSTHNLVLVKDNAEQNFYTNPQGHTIILHSHPKEDAMEYFTEFQNTGKETATIELLSSVALQGIVCDKIHRLQSFWSAEGRLKTDNLTDLQLEPSWSGYGMRTEKFGNLGSMPIRKYFPWIVLENSKKSEFIGIQLYCPSSWQIEILCIDDTVSVVCGIADRDFGHWFKHLAVGETFVTPKAVVAKGDSLAEVCDKLGKAQSPNVSSVDEDMGIAFNEFCTTWGNPKFENIKKIADNLKGKGIKYLVVDCGWYADDTGWEITIGDWVANKDMFPNGLKEVADYIKACGMIPGLWFEMEITGRNAKAFHNTDHLLKKDGVVITTGDRRFWDMSDPWVVDYLSEKVIQTLKDCGFGYLKVDYNDSIGIGCDGAESLGEGLRQRVQASQDFFRKIKREIPELVIENCSSGGHRLEPSMMELVSQASFSDAHETTSIPIIAANLHRAIKPSQSQIWAVLRANDSESRLIYSMVNTFLGRMCLSGDIYDLSDEQWAVVDNGIAFYKKAVDIIKYGKTIRIENNIKSYNHPTGEQVVIRDYGNQRLVVAHRFADSKPIPQEILHDCRIIESYGKADGDFTAQAWILEINKLCCGINVESYKNSTTLVFK
jgi:alpha-galactosidase